MWRRAQAETCTAPTQSASGSVAEAPTPELTAVSSPPTAATKARAEGPVVVGAVAELRRMIAVFRASNADTVLSTRRMINPLLDLWSVASTVDHNAAAPIEALLVTFVARLTTTPAELAATLDEVEWMLERLSSH